MRGTPPRLAVAAAIAVISVAAPAVADNGLVQGPTITITPQTANATNSFPTISLDHAPYATVTASSTSTTPTPTPPTESFGHYLVRTAEAMPELVEGDALGFLLGAKDATWNLTKLGGTLIVDGGSALVHYDHTASVLGAMKDYAIAHPGAALQESWDGVVTGFQKLWDAGSGAVVGMSDSHWVDHPLEAGIHQTHPVGALIGSGAMGSGAGLVIRTGIGLTRGAGSEVALTSSDTPTLQMAGDKTPPYENLYFRDSDGAGQAVIRDGAHDPDNPGAGALPPRYVLADPAGNTGVGLFGTAPFAPGTSGLQFEGPLTRVEYDGMQGLRADISGPESVTFRNPIMDNVRTLRDEDGAVRGGPGMRDRVALVNDAIETVRNWNPTDPEAQATRQVLLTRLEQTYNPPRVVDPSRPDTLIFEREAVGSGARYRTEITPGPNTKLTMNGDQFTLEYSPVAPPPNWGIRGFVDYFVPEGPVAPRTSFSVRTYLNRAPLTRIPGLPPDLDMLASEEGINAGGWQYFTPFGRDGDISVMLMKDVVDQSGQTPQWVYDLAGVRMRTTLDKVSPNGVPSHETDLGDQATLRRLRLMQRLQTEGSAAKLTMQDLRDLEKPVEDYKMIDGPYTFPQVLDEFVPRMDQSAVEQVFTDDRLAALSRIVKRIDDQTSLRNPDGSFKPIELNEGEDTGQWRDSREGIGWSPDDPSAAGRAPLDVNAYLAPSSLRSLANLVESPRFPLQRLLDASGSARDQLTKMLDPATLRARADAWEAQMLKQFEVSLTGPETKAALNAYMQKLPADFRAALLKQKMPDSDETLEQALGPASTTLDGGRRFMAVALDASGKPVPVMNTDIAFRLFYGAPGKDELLRDIQAIVNPFPSGLMLGNVGPVVANPGLSWRPTDPETFAPGKYHGAVVWGWQSMKMMQQGLQKQLTLYAGDPEATAAIKSALARLDQVDTYLGRVGQRAELWSGVVDGNGQIVPRAYGASLDDATEANDCQLWTAAGAACSAPPAAVLGGSVTGTVSPPNAPGRTVPAPLPVIAPPTGQQRGSH